MILRSELGPIIETDGKTVGQVAGELAGRLKAIPWEGHGESSLWDAYESGIGVSVGLEFALKAFYPLGRATPWPGDSAWRVVCYPVYGSSEGNYLHVDALLPHPVTESAVPSAELVVMPLLLGKLLLGEEGPDMACFLAGVNSKLLGLV